MQDYSIVLSKLAGYYSPQRVTQIKDFLIALNQSYNDEINIFDNLLEYLNADDNDNSTAVNNILNYYISQARQQIESYYIVINEDYDGDEIVLYTKLINTIYLFRTYGQASDFTACFDEGKQPIQILFDVVSLMFPDDTFEPLYFGMVTDVNHILTDKLRNIYEDRLNDEIDKINQNPSNTDNHRYAVEVTIADRMRLFVDLYLNMDDEPAIAFKDKLIDEFTGTVPLTLLEDNFYPMYETVDIKYHNRLWLLIFLMKVFSDIKNRVAYEENYSVSKLLDDFINDLNQFYVNPDEYHYVSSEIKTMYDVYLKAVKAQEG